MQNEYLKVPVAEVASSTPLAELVSQPIATDMPPYLSA